MKTIATLAVGITRVSTLVVFAALLPVADADAQQADTSGWKCEYCPFEQGYRADTEVGATTVNSDSAYFGNASGYDESGVYADIDTEGSFVSDDYQMRWLGEDLGLDSRYAEIEGGRQGTYDFRLGYSEIPQKQFFTTDTVFTESSDASLALPAGWVPASLTSGFTQLDASLFNKDIESKRKQFEVGGRYLQLENLTFSADFSRQKRDGVDIVGGSFFFQSSLLPAEFEYTTDEVDLGVRYDLSSGYVAIGWRLSDFDNDNTGYRWDNPFISFNDPAAGQLAQPPDNTFQQLSLTGAYSFAKLRTVLGFSAALGEMEQDNDLLPYTINTNLSPAALPTSSLDAKVDTTAWAVTLNTKLTERATIRTAYRYDKRDNKTPQYTWMPVITDNFVSAAAETNTAYSYDRATFSLSGDYKLTDTVRASAGYDYKTMHRDDQEVKEQYENIGWGRVRWRPNALLEIDVRGGGSERDIKSYNEDLAIELGQNPLLRKYELAYRERFFGEVTATITPPESTMSLAVSSMYAKDDYSNTRLGLTEGKDFNLNADIGWTFSEKASLFVSGGYERLKSDQANSEQFAAPDWKAKNDDKFLTFVAGLQVKQIINKVDMQLDYTRSQGRSEIRMDSASGGASRFPDLESTLDYLRLKLVYRHSEQLEINTGLTYQSFSADDWALQNVEPATIPTVLSLGAQPYDDDQFIVGFGFRYKLGQNARNVSGE